MGTCPCLDSIKVVEKIYASKKHASTSHWVVDTVRVHGLIADSAAADVRFHVEPYAILNADGTVFRQYGREQSHIDFSLVRRSQRWLLSNAFDLDSK